MDYKKLYEDLKKDYEKKTKRLNFILKQSDSLTKELHLQMEKAKQLADVKSEFLSNMSHEIRTPLNAIMGFIELMKEEDDGKFKKYLDVIDSSSKTLLTIINDILDLSKIEAGKISIENVNFSCNELFYAIELFEERASKKQIEYKTNFVNLPKYLIGDVHRIKQVISNLLSNAIKFTPENKKIEVDVEYKNNSLFVMVKDEGIGIPEQKLLTIFDAFNQADNSITRKYGGTGLGLTISYKLIQLLGGELKVQSKENQGSKFYFEIPIKKGKEENHIIDCKNMNNKHIKILLAEDNKANQMFMKVIFKKLNIDFEIVDNGEEVIKLLKQNKQFDIILMDINMPVLDGIEATKIVRDMKKDIPIIALTASVLKDEKDRYILVGMNDVLEKPLDIEKLKKVINQFLK